MKKSTAVSAAKNELTIGLDLGDRKHHACVLSAAGDIFREEVLPNTRECVLAFAQRFPGATFVMETGTHCSAPRPEGTRSLRPLLRCGQRLAARHLRAAALRPLGSRACSKRTVPA